MSRAIDERIVEMRFDNKQFESGIKESMGSLHKLDELLKTNISAKSLDDISKAANNINVSGLNKAIEFINSRFSVLGIAAARVIENLTDGLVNGLGNAIRSTTDSIVSGGVKRAMNIENAHFQLQGLISDEKEVQAIMQQANESVDGTAYSYDVAAKAASMFAATGIKSGEKMETALKGIAGVAATTNADYERVSQIFTTISGQGRVMADQLNQFANMGLNAAAALTTYMNNVNSGTAEASDEVKAYIEQITGGVQITEAELRDMVSKSQISFDLFSEVMGRSFGEHAKDANKTFTGAMANIRAALARTGAMFISPLISQDGEFVQFFNAIRIKVNEFNKALGASNGLAKQFTDWVRKIVSHLTEIVENFKIANVYTRTFGDGVEKVFESAHTTVQKFGDGTQKIVDRDVYTPFHALVNIVHTFINVMKGLHSILSPIGQAFREVFIDSINSNDIYKVVESIEELSRHFKLSGEHAEQLKQGFTGIFSIIKSVVKIFGRLAKAINPSISETDDLGDSIFDLIEWIGQLLEKFANWIDETPEVEKAISTLGAIISTVAEAVSSAFSTIVKWLQNSDISGKISTISAKFDGFKESITGLIPQSVQTAFNAFIDSLKALSGISLSDITESISGLMQAIKDIIKGDVKFDEIGDHLISGLTIGLRNGISNVIKVAKELANTLLQTVKDWLGIHSPSTEGEEIGENFIQGIINGLRAGFDKIKGKAAELASNLLSGTTEGFGNLNEILSQIIALVGGGALAYLLIQLGRGFQRVSKAIKGIVDIGGAINSLKAAIKAYSKELRAEAFKKQAIALSIGIATITAALFVLSKIDPKALWPSVLALSITMALLGTVITSVMKISRQAKPVENALNTAAKGFKKGFENLGKALKIKAIGSAVKDFVIAIGIIILDIVGIYLLYKHDEAGFIDAVGIVAAIAGFIMLMIGTMSALGERFNEGMKAFAKVSAGVLALSLAVLVAVKAIKDLLALEFNWSDDIGKVALLASLFVMVGALAIAVGKASNIAGNGGLKTGPLLAMCAMIATSVWALKSIMDMDLSDDWGIKLGILAGLFVALGLLMIAVGKASEIAGGKIKAAGTILAMCAFIATAVAAIVILAVFPAEALKKGALALGGILLTLAVVLLAASKMSNASSGAVVLGMAIIIATIVAALAFLSFMDWTKMLPGAFSLGVILLAVALVFSAVAKITNENIWKTVAAMVAMVAVVTGGLYVLSKVESWENLLAAALAMSAVLLAVAKAFSIINNSQNPSIDHIMEFILGVIAVAAIAHILRTTADIPWETLLASGAAISAVLLSIAESFNIINSTNEIKLDKIVAFIFGVIGAAVIGIILSLVANTPWESLLGMAASIGLVLIAIGAAFAIMDKVQVNLTTIGAFIAGCLGVAAIGLAISEAAKQPWQQLLAAGVAISVVILAMSVAMVLCAAAGALAPEAAVGILLLDAFIADLYAVLLALDKWGSLSVIQNGGQMLSEIGKTLGNFVGSIVEGISEGVGRALENIGTSLSNFMANAQPFFDGLSNINQDTVKAAGALAGVIVALAVAEFLNGVTNLMSVFTGTNDMPTFGEKLVSFGKSIKLFDESTRGVDGNNVAMVAEAAKSLIDIAKAIPNSGGLLGKIMGENDIDVFGQKLAAFGPSLALFDLSVRSIKDTSNWKNIADGTLALIDMADQIPNSGGWLAKVVGDNDIGKFGESLANFAKQIKPFHNNVMGITDISSWKNVATGTQYLVDMAQSIPNEGGAISLFTGDNGIAEFGKSVLKFGIYMSEFDKYVKNIPLTTFTNISTGMSHLISMCKSLKEIDPDVMVTFSNNMAKMAKEGLTSFISTFQSETVVAINTVRSTILQIKDIAQNDTSVQTAFYNLAKRNMTQYMKGITDQTRSLLTTLTTLLNSITKTIKSKDNEYKTLGTNHARLYTDAVNSFISKAKTVGENVGKSTVSGIASVANSLKDTSEKLAQVFTTNFERAGKDKARDAAMELTNAAVRVFNDRNDTFKECGENAGEGFARGMRRKVDDVADVARDMAWEARRAIEDELGIYSPSRVLRADGQYTGEGFALGILDRIREVKRAALTLGNSSIDGFEDAISAVSDITEELDPVITPIVDLTDVMEAADTINDLFSKAISTVSGNIGEASNSMTRRQSTNNQQNIQNGNDNNGTNVTFIQNNNSPKALSRLDIYRDTRNQLLQFREVTNSL